LGKIVEAEPTFATESGVGTTVSKATAR